MNKAWLWVAAAGLLEVAWAVGLKVSDGLTRPAVSLFTVLGMLLSFVFLSQGMRTLPVGTAYAVWTGIGASGTALVGVLLLAEPATAGRLFCLLLIIAGIAGLKWLG
jgi:quaternary ammonium compound-resistance protein SugE